MTHAMDLFKLKGKVALVTGGGRGLGYFAAEGLAEAGASVAICGRGMTGDLDEAAARIKETGSDCIAMKCDVMEEDAVVELAQTVKKHYGRCDILVNNAGIGGISATEQLITEEWNRMMDVNLRGTFLCCREFGKNMIQQKSGNIINLSSQGGQVGFPGGMAA